MNTALRKIDQDTLVADIVRNDYRTADVFRKYGIEYCCGGKWPLRIACESRHLEVAAIIKELENARRTIALPGDTKFEDWDTEFLVNYIINIHHTYLKNSLQSTAELLDAFAQDHQKEFSYLAEVATVFNDLVKEMLPHLQYEEQFIFPYIRQIAHAFHNKESYAGLLVRTLRKPIENFMFHEHESVNKMLNRLRELTSDYTLPSKYCLNHKVVFLKLREIDNDLVQHVHLENNILFPRAIKMEQELLQKKE